MGFRPPPPSNAMQLWPIPTTCTEQRLGPSSRFTAIHSYDRPTNDIGVIALRNNCTYAQHRGDKQEFRRANRSWPAYCSTSSSSTQRTVIVNNRFRASHSFYSSCPQRWRDEGRARFTTTVVWRQVEQEAHIWNPNISPWQRLGRIWVWQQNQRFQLPTE